MTDYFSNCRVNRHFTHFGLLFSSVWIKEWTFTIREYKSFLWFAMVICCHRWYAK